MGIEQNRRFLADLFSGPFRGHAITLTPDFEPPWEMGDYAITDRPVADWVPWALRNYEKAVKWQEEIGDDSVPYVQLNGTTGFFASAFGCPMHVFADNQACAGPLVTTVEEADRLPRPSLDSPSISRFFELAERVREELGPDAPISVPDIQTPFDIGALVWRKEDFYRAIIDDPDAVRRLVDKCHILLISFLDEFLSRFPECNLCQCVYGWAPPKLGCWFSEDEAGAISARMYEEFCLPTTIDLSEHYGGMFHALLRHGGPSVRQFLARFQTCAALIERSRSRARDRLSRRFRARRSLWWRGFHWKRYV